MTKLKKRASEFEFATLTASLTRDMIVHGAADHSLRERLLRDADLSLAKAINAGHAAEKTKRHAKELAKHQQSVEVHEVRHQQERSSNKHPAKGSQLCDNVIKQCKFCRGSHPRSRCPAYGKRCRKCNQKTILRPAVPAKELIMSRNGALPLQPPPVLKMKTIFSLTL